MGFEMLHVHVLKVASLCHSRKLNNVNLLTAVVPACAPLYYSKVNNFQALVPYALLMPVYSPFFMAAGFVFFSLLALRAGLYCSCFLPPASFYVLLKAASPW